ncbi:hypothetical protein [Branchiibius cervicis]|uniref:Uncharacterized protein n=1 Tax=Branchiibius cervicis TaxID=908252 RepID=A0ABW2APC0_9MICO
MTALHARDLALSATGTAPARVVCLPVDATAAVDARVIAEASRGRTS